jgi:hypothetical protein
MPEIERLRATVQSLYEVFSPHGLREHIDICNHCHDLEDALLLRSRGLRELGVNELHQYIWDAIDLWGDDYDFRHFLPRILEGLAFDERLTDDFVDPAIVLGKLRSRNWAHWPTKEQDAVRRHLFGLWESQINHKFPWELYSEPFIEDWLCGIGQAEEDLDPYLAGWELADSYAAIGNLSHVVVSSEKELREGKLGNPLESDRQEQSVQVVRWLLGPNVRAKLLDSSTQNLPPTSLEWVKRACATLGISA